MRDSETAANSRPDVGKTNMLGAAVPAHWKQWAYFEWNRKLAEYFFFVRTPEERDFPLERVSATPEELTRVAGIDPTFSAAVVEAFVGRVRHELKPGQGFCDHCLGYYWDPEEYPPFFAMLWFTCLVAYGYPESDGSFSERLAKALGKSENFHGPGVSPCLPTLWESVARWSDEQHRSRADVRRLVLPSNVGRRTVIGYSHFLAFPNRFDRIKLADMLRDADLIGAEPPIRLLLDTLLRHRRHFSSEFQEDLGDFSREYTEGRDPRESAFWRAIRQEAMLPSGGAEKDSSIFGSIVFVGDDDGLAPVLAWRPDFSPPEGYFIEPFDDGNWGSRLVGPNEDRELPVREAVTLGKLLGPRDRRLLTGGVVPLRENDSGLFEPVSGEDVHGCRSALVKDALTSEFCRRFGGITRPSILSGWREVHECNIVQLDELPLSLVGATSLLRTTELPSIAFADGIPVSDGFLFAPPFLPKIHAFGAVALEVQLPGGSWVECIHTKDGEWLLPPTVSTPGDYLINSKWPISTETGIIHRTRTTALRLRSYTVTNYYRGLPSGEFFQEACSQYGESALKSPDEPALTVTTADPTRSTDVVDFDATVRFLGPGVGEMALAPRPDFDWLAIGPKNDPELVMYVGDLENPTPPRAARSPSAGDRRHWHKAWHVAESRRYCRTTHAHCVAWNYAPAVVQAVWACYRRHSVPPMADLCAETRLDTLTFSHFSGELAEPSVATVLEAIAALSTERRGLSYPLLSNLFSQLLGQDDVLLIRQLIRAWVEGNFIDEVRHAVTGRMLFVARRPQLVLVHRGPIVEATLVGLNSPATSRQFANAATRLSLPIVELHPCNRWQPTILRTRGQLLQLEQLGAEMDFRSSVWLEWPDRNCIPSGLDAQTALATLFTTTPPNSFAHDARWDWTDGIFKRGEAEPAEGIQLTRRIDWNQLRIYVVSMNGRPVCWTFQRSWALLAAYERRGTTPFIFDDASGQLMSVGRASVHLPLPIARLCVLIGEGAPGPCMTAGEQPGYLYPFGRRLFALIRQAVPGAWITSP